jgi:DNA-binding HxlR family transcriptional regulator
MLQRPDPFNAQCPTRRVLDRIGDSWAVLILIALGDGTLRFNALRRRIENISQKMLSQTLKSLERDGLIRREAFATVPVTVEYSLTELGRTLAATVDSLRLWAEANIGAIEDAQRRYDYGAPALADEGVSSGR